MPQKQRRRIYWTTAIVFFATVFVAFAQPALNYVVVAGDVLDLIALEYDVSLSCVADANTLNDPGLIFPGDVITIPQECPAYNGQSYIPGISDQRDQVIGQGGGSVSVMVESQGRLRTTCNYDPILQRNFNGSTYTVQQFDMLDFIACDLDVQTKCLAEANNLSNPGYLQIGQELSVDVSCPAWGEPISSEAIENIS
ncbi:LysM peptidoglycan-binding domain-containing protein [Phototrophicus methaneseepsis]|uniref:LysM peptidoglycan-binding domain-containing protein n=1 Tax=Phototrophicus methaneseepsis TaxID=2710758 RepID=A0A7S8E7U1_9CHLR|nr:LysM peptidoglycan-binding domain-containing protein [Phototrophicus methaneseepsis]QPC81952.1 LysM peptidoglycan-binding domain-containing protein [Phototrophicus methaneseepsis]